MPWNLSKEKIALKGDVILLRLALRNGNDTALYCATTSSKLDVQSVSALHTQLLKLPTTVHHVKDVMVVPHHIVASCDCITAQGDVAVVEPLQVKGPRHVVDKVPARKELVDPNLLGDVVLGVGEDLDADGDEGLVSRDVPLGGQHLNVMILHKRTPNRPTAPRHGTAQSEKVVV